MATNFSKKASFALASFGIVLIAFIFTGGADAIAAAADTATECQLAKARVTVVLWLVGPSGSIDPLGPENKPKPKPDEKPAVRHPDYCQCHGTGHVKSGDGIIDVPCPCGDHCTCKKAEEPPEPAKPAKPEEPETPTKPTAVVEPVLPTRQLICISASWCINCGPMKRAIRGLQATGWDAGRDRESLIALLDADADLEHTRRYGELLLPCVLVLNNGEVEARYSGRVEVPDNAYGLANLLLGNQSVMDYKTPRGKLVTQTRTIAMTRAPTTKPVITTTIVQPAQTFYYQQPATYWYHDHRGWRR